MTTAPAISPDLSAMMRRRGMTEWTLSVVGTSEVTPLMRRVSLTAADLSNFNPVAGQDLVLMLPDGQGGLGRRHYTVRAFDRATGRIDIDVVLHGEVSPGPRWALSAKPGDTVLAFGPRGRNVLRPGAEWRLFVGDETAIPAILGMLETLQRGERASAVIEIENDAERQAVRSAGEVSVEWISRSGPAKAGSAALIGWMARQQLPAGIGHIYLLGETSTIRQMRHDLLSRGVGKEQIFGEGYWRPGRVGGHDHLEEH